MNGNESNITALKEQAAIQDAAWMEIVSALRSRARSGADVVAIDRSHLERLDECTTFAPSCGAADLGTKGNLVIRA